MINIFWLGRKRKPKRKRRKRKQSFITHVKRVTVQDVNTFMQPFFTSTCNLNCLIGSNSLFYLFVKFLSSRSKKPEIVTCTQRKQNWGKVSKEVAKSVLEPQQIREFGAINTTSHKMREKHLLIFCSVVIFRLIINLCLSN